MKYLLPFTTMSFAYPWLLAFPLVCAVIYLLQKKHARAVLIPQVATLRQIPVSLRLILRKPLLGILSTLSILSLSIAAARPQFISNLPQQREARNLMLALDLSRSMRAKDFDSDNGRLTRIDAVRLVVGEFIKARADDRLGITVFGSQAMLLSPLTLDHGLILDLVERLKTGLAGDGTAIGDGLGVSLKRIKDVPGDSKAIILLTDGVSNSGQVNPIKAAKVARDLGIKIHTVGIGSSQPVTIRMPGDLFFQRSFTQVEFDEKTLIEIAKITGGVYFNAQSFEGLKKVYEEIDKLESTESDDIAPQKIEELFVPFALSGLISYLLYLVLSRSILMKLP
ncbi:MAG: VWA domain-containing protein [Bdellovibrionales bacterium]|nr:VWA domain-containing protein [Bdellovibrionales bacterium]